MGMENAGVNSLALLVNSVFLQCSQGNVLSQEPRQRSPCQPCTVLSKVCGHLKNRTKPK